MRAASALALARRLLRDRCTFSDARWFCSTNAERGKTAKRPAHKPATLAANTKHITDHSDIPIEKLSLSRGLALNRFEKVSTNILETHLFLHSIMKRGRNFVSSH